MDYNIIDFNQWKIIVKYPIFIKLPDSKNIIDFINNLNERKILNEHATVSIEELISFNNMICKFIHNNPLDSIPNDFKFLYLWIYQWEIYSLNLSLLFIREPSALND